MLRQVTVAYILGAFTFWPIVGLCIYVTLRHKRPIEPDGGPTGNDAGAEEAKRAARAKVFEAEHLARLNSSANGIKSTPDLESDVNISCWLRLAPTYISSAESYEDTEGQLPKQTKQPSSTARNSLQKLVSGSNFFGSVNTPSAGGIQNSAARSDSGSGIIERSDVSTASSISASDTGRPKSVSKCPKYWAVIRGSQLQLFEDESQKKLVDFFLVPQFVVSLWPQDLQEYELFYKRYPIVLISRTDPEGIISLDMYSGVPPRDALYLYIENPVEKEDLYFALVKESMGDGSRFSSESQQLSLGPRDPTTMAQPIKVKKAEAQFLLSSIWNNDQPQDTQWLNALIGRVFLALKDSSWADDYLRRKFRTKLKPISDSSNIIGDIEVKNINSGASAPYVSNVKLKELTPDGNLVLSVRVNYSGGFKVILKTSVKLAAVTSLTTVEIPVELAATLRSLKGSIILRIKPAPSERIWYAFETMPDVDLHVEPAVYETHISLSVVTKFIKSKILDSLKETLVMPFMDDICFYDTTGSFYRGGIWETPSKTKDSKGHVAEKQVLNREEQQKQPKNPYNGGGKSAVKTQSQHKSDTGSFVQNLESAVRSTVSAGEEWTASSISTNSSSPYTSQLRNRAPPDNSDQESSNSELTSNLPSSSSSTVQKITNWVKSKRSVKDIKTPEPPLSPAVESSGYSGYGSNLSDTDSIVSMSPSSHRRQRAVSTTQVTAANVSKDTLLPQDRNNSESPLRKQTVRRKPVPSNTAEPDKLDFPTHTRSSPSTEMSNESIKGEITVEQNPLSRRSSFSSFHSRKSSFPNDAGSIRSGNSLAGPTLPPRHRRVVPLSNVAPERDV